MSSSLERFRSLLGRLESSRAKSRRGGRVRRSDPAREAEQKKRQEEYRANQDRYRGDFELEGDPFAMRQQVVVGWHNPETGARWSAPNPGYKPKEGTGWVKGYGPSKRPELGEVRIPDGYDQIGDMRIPEKGEFFGRPGGGRDFSGSDRLISSIKEKPPAASTGNKGKDFERMLRSRMSKF
jgi:hypothetical protein